MLKQIQTTSNLICKSLKELKLQSSTEYGIFTQAHSPPIQATHQKLQKNKLVCKGYTQDILFTKLSNNFKSIWFQTILY
jgi:hypothetical protein